MSFLYELWAHECTRVFSDWLINVEDLALFEQLFFKTVEEEKITVLDPSRFDLHSNLFNFFSNYDPNAFELTYDQAPNDETWNKQVEEILDLYNSGTKEPMSLMIFEYAVMHLSWLARIIAKPFGNGLLIGIGGNGRHCLTKLATFINQG